MNEPDVTNDNSEPVIICITPNPLKRKAKERNLSIPLVIMAYKVYATNIKIGTDPAMCRRSKILVDNLLPNMISVETYFQGFPKYNQKLGRQRTDGKNEFESKLKKYCLIALQRRISGQKLSAYDVLYLSISSYLDKLICNTKLTTKEEKTLQAYKKLISLYNENNPEEKVQFLHRGQENYI